LRGRGEEPWALERVPPLGELKAFARVELRGEDAKVAAVAKIAVAPQPFRVALRLVPSAAPWRSVTASWIDRAQLPLLRRLAYALPHATIARTTVAVTDRGVVLRAPGGIEAIPLGTFFVEVHPSLFIPGGYEVAPAVAPDVLHRALGAPADQVVFLTTEARAIAVDEAAFVPLETALLESPDWEPTVAQSIERVLEAAPIALEPGPLGVFPLAGAEPPQEG
jgi:hypothetical protein